jgi:hypothetical protein
MKIAKTNKSKRIIGYLSAAIAFAAIAAFILLSVHTHHDGLIHANCAICVVVSTGAIVIAEVPAFVAILTLCCIIPTEFGSNRIPDSPHLAILSRAPPSCC